MNDSETVGSADLLSNMLFMKQKQQVQSMRSALLSCDEEDAFSVKSSMQKILVMRIYHQITRIIRYTEEMDKIENKLYEAIDVAIENMDASYLEENNFTALNTLLGIQEKLQRSMIESQKLLDPYLNIKELTYIDVPTEVSEVDNTVNGHVLDQDSRKRLREGAQAALEAINMESNESKEPVSVE